MVKFKLIFRQVDKHCLLNKDTVPTAATPHSGTQELPGTPQLRGLQGEKGAEVGKSPAWAGSREMEAGNLKLPLLFLC